MTRARRLLAVAAFLVAVFAASASAATGPTPLRAVLATVRVPDPGNVSAVWISLRVPLESDTGRATVVVSGLADDSVRAIRRRLTLERLESGAWRARVRSTEYRCARGGSGDWQRELCP